MGLRIAYTANPPSASAGERRGGGGIPSLASALADLGPMSSALGLYLSARVDLLPARECLALAAIPDLAPAMSEAVVWSLLHRELGRDPGSVFSSFDTTPLRSRVLFQVHDARLANGEPVTVRVRRPEIEAGPEVESEWRAAVENALGRHLSRTAIDHVLADFHRSWSEQCDFRRAAETMVEFAREAADSDWLLTPLVRRELCTRRVLVSEPLAGVSLADVLGRRGPQGAAAVSGMDARPLARRLCRLWLERALSGGLFPMSPRADDIVLLPNQQLCFAGMGFACLPEEARGDLRDYLIATSTDDADRACARLLRGVAARSDRDADALRRRMRHSAPFRDGGWGDGDRETLGGRIALHCRFACEQGYVLRESCLAFLGSVFLLAFAAQALAADDDPLLEALEDARVASTVADLRDLLGLREGRENADRYAAVFMELPTRLDQALSRAAGEGDRESDAARPPRAQGQKSTPAAVAALALLLVAVVLMSGPLASLSSGEGFEKLGALAFVFVGALLLRAVIQSE